MFLLCVVQKYHRVLFIITKENSTKAYIKKWLCPEFIDLIMENNRPHKSGANKTLYKVSMKGLLLFSYISILTSPVCFSVKKKPLQLLYIYLFPQIIPV